LTTRFFRFDVLRSTWYLGKHVTGSSGADLFIIDSGDKITDYQFGKPQANRTAMWSSRRASRSLSVDGSSCLKIQGVRQNTPFRAL